jgi:RNase P/RNase MRP subunit p30
MKNRAFFFVVVFFLCSNILLAQNTPKNIPVNEPQTPQSLETISTELENISKSLVVFNQRLNDFLESLNKYKGIQLSEKQQKLLFGYEVLNQTEQLSATLRKSVIETGEREAAIKRRLGQVEFDLRPENIERSVQLLGSTKAVEARENRRRTLETEQNDLRNLLMEVQTSRAQVIENLRQTEMFARSFRQNLFTQIQNAMKDF